MHERVSLCACFRFTAGDVVMMRPCNAVEDVEQFCQLLRLNPDTQFTLVSTDDSSGVCMIEVEADLESLS